MIEQALLVGVATTILAEIGKRDKNIPIDPNNPNQIKFVCAIISLILAIIGALKMGALGSFDWRTSLGTILQLWIEGWFTAHLAYQTVPFLKEDKTESEEESGK